MPINTPKRKFSSKSYGSSKFSKASSSSKSRSGTVATTGVNKTWPYQKYGWGPLYDPFPKSMRAIMRYSDTISISAVAGTTGVYLFRANSIFDPDFTGIGHQPYGHDTYQNIYNHYMVESAVITMQNTETANVIYGITLDADSTPNLTYNTPRELKGTNMVVNSSNKGQSGKVMQKYNAYSALKPDVGPQSAASSFGVNPGDTEFFVCWAQADSSQDTLNPRKFLITITYVVQMWELKDLGGS